MIANDARCMVYDVMPSHGYDVPQSMIDDIDSQIVQAAEKMQFSVTLELFSTSNYNDTQILRESIYTLYRSLGYDCHIEPFNGMFIMTISW